MVDPSQMLEAAMEMDTILWNVVECCALPPSQGVIRVWDGSVL